MASEIITEILRTFGPIVWIIPVVYSFFIYQRRRDYDRFQMERQIKLEELERQQYLSHRMSREVDREDRYNPKLLEELIYRLERLDQRPTTRSSEPQDKELPTHLDSTLNALTLLQNVSTDTGTDTSEQLIRELSHSLNTPLSQIEVSATIALSTINNKEELEKSIQSISDSVQVCKAFLGAFRELVISGSAAVWNPKSLEEAIRSATQVYTVSQNKEIFLELDLTETIEGYSNNYIAAVVLPILENAIEASKESKTVAVRLMQEGENNFLHVTNEPENEPGGDEIYDAGFTTKENHEGTGLTIVKHLLSASHDAKLYHTFKPPLVTFTISLPRRVK